MRRMTPLSYLATKAGNWLQLVTIAKILLYQFFIVDTFVLHQEIVKRLNNNLIKHTITNYDHIFHKEKSRLFLFSQMSDFCCMLESLII